MSTLGVLYTGRMGNDYGNHVAGADGFFRLDQKNSVIVQFLHSETNYPGEIASDYGQSEGRFGGNAVSLQFQHFSRYWIVNAMYEDLSTGFRADYGFVPRVDTRTATATVFRQFWGKPKGWFNLIRLGVMGESVWNHAGTLTDRGLTLGLAYQGNLESLVNLHANFLRTFYNGQYFDTAFGQAIGRIRPFSGAEVGVQAMAGQTIDYANSRLAQGLSVGPNLSLNIFRRLNLVVSHAYERLSLHGDTIYIANLTPAQARLELQRPVLRPGHPPVQRPGAESRRLHVPGRLE